MTCKLSLPAILHAHSLVGDFQVVILTGSTLLAALCVLALKSLPPVPKAVNSSGAKLKLKVGSHDELLHRPCSAYVHRARYGMASVKSCLCITTTHVQQHGPSAAAAVLTTWHACHSHECICIYQQRQSSFAQGSWLGTQSFLTGPWNAFSVLVTGRLT